MFCTHLAQECLDNYQKKRTPDQHLKEYKTLEPKSKKGKPPQLAKYLFHTLIQELTALKINIGDVSLKDRIKGGQN